MFPQKLMDAFVHNVEISIDKEGIHPFPIMHFDGSGGLTVGALMVPPNQCLDIFWSIICKGECSAIIMGMDRSTRPDQGTEFADVLTVTCWWDDPKMTWKATHRAGVINYQHEPRIIRPIDWGNSFWNKQVTNELESSRPLFKAPVTYREDRK